MALNLQSLETISLADKFASAFASDICEDGRISLLTENNVFVYTMLNYMDHDFGDMAFKKNMIKIPKLSLQEELKNYFVKPSYNVRHYDLNEIMKDLDLGNTEYSPIADIKPVAIKWSPKGLQGKSYCVLAILNNMHGLSIMAEYRDIIDYADYSCVTNVTKHIAQMISNERENITQISSPNDWKKLTLDACPTAFEWSHIIENTNEVYAILFVAHSNGSVSSWKYTRIVENTLEPSPLQFVGKFESQVSNVSVMYWRSYGGNVGTLCLGNYEGQLSVVSVTNLNTEILNYEGEQTIGANVNKKKVLYITSIEYNQYCFLISVLEEFLHIFLVLEDGTIVDEMYYNTGNTTITGLCHYKENVLLFLTSARLKKLILNVENNKVRIKDETISVNFDDSTFRGCGLISSKNRVFFGILAYPCRLKDIAKHPTPSKFFIYHDASKVPLKIILKNTENNLTDYWDCFEVLRMISFKERKFPWHGIGNLNYDKLTLQQLKSLRWISKLSEHIYNIVPQITAYNIKPYILLHHLVTIQLVVNRMRKLLNDISQGNSLSLFQMRSLDICNMYLKEMVMMKILEKSKVGERFVDDMIEVMEIANEIEYPDMPQCFWCGEKIIGPSCLQPHKDSRCSISMMQIYLTAGFKCPFCKCLAHIEIAKECDTVICPYCDVPMYERYSKTNVENALKDTDELTREKMELSLLMDVPENIHPHFDFHKEEEDSWNFENIVDYVALSDSDEDKLVKERIKTLHNAYYNKKTISDYDKSLQGLDDSHILSDDNSKGNDSLEEEWAENNSSEVQSERIISISSSDDSLGYSCSDNYEDMTSTDGSNGVDASDKEENIEQDET